MSPATNSGRRTRRWRTLLAGTVDFLRPLVEPTGMSIEFELDPDALWAHFDRARIEQVVVNLVTNGLRHAASGGRLVLATRPLAGGGELGLVRGERQRRRPRDSPRAAGRGLRRLRARCRPGSGTRSRPRDGPRDLPPHRRGPRRPDRAARNTRRRLLLRLHLALGPSRKRPTGTAGLRGARRARPRCEECSSGWRAMSGRAEARASAARWWSTMRSRSATTWRTCWSCAASTWTRRPTAAAA